MINFPPLQSGNNGLAHRERINAAVQTLNGQRTIYPHLLARGGLVETIPLVSGIPVNPIKNGVFTGAYDMAPAIRHAMIEARKAQPSALAVGIFGAQVIRSAFIVGFGCGRIFGHNQQGSAVIYDGPEGGVAYRAGNLHQDLTQFPITGVSVASGRTTLTIGSTNQSAKSVAALADPFVSLSYTDALGAPVSVDAWGQWVGMFEFLGLTDGTAYARLPVFSIDAAARTVTVTGTVAFTPTHLHAPGLVGATLASATYSSVDSVNPLHLFTMIEDITFHLRDRGIAVQGSHRGAKGLADERLRKRNVVFVDPVNPNFNYDSDSFVDTMAMNGSDGPYTISAVDSTIHQLEFTATRTRGIIFPADMSQTTLTGRCKGYYLGQSAAAKTESWACEFSDNLSGLKNAGHFILEDTAGGFWHGNMNALIYFPNVELNNIGAVGWGAPGTIGGPGGFIDADAHYFARNDRMAEMFFKGIIRAATGNRDGAHVRSAAYFQSNTGLDTALPPTDSNSTAAAVARPFLCRNIHLEYDLVDADHQQWNLQDWPGINTPVWDSARADYPMHFVVRLPIDANNRAASRYRSVVANPTPGLSPETNTAQWQRRGGGRNAWLSGFIEEAPTNPAWFREFWNFVLILNGQRDPSYHQRLLSGRTAYTVDPEHDLVRVNTATGAAIFDVFPGREGKEQIWRLEAGANSLTLAPGSRNNGTILNRQATVPFQAGASWVLSRLGSEFKVVHRGGQVRPIPHDQVENLGALTSLAVNLSDFGKTLNIGATAACTVTFPDANSLPANWYVDLALTGTGSLSLSGVVGASSVTAQWSGLRVSRAGAVLIGRA